MRPLLFWLLVMSVATVYFLGESVRPPGLAGGGVAGSAQAYADLAWDALGDPPRCFAKPRHELAVEQKIDEGGRISKAGEEKKLKVTFSGLTSTAFESTNALKEAINLSWHNAFIVLDGGAEFGAPHLWLPLWRRALWRQSGDVRAKQRRAGVGRAEAAVGAVHLPVRSRAPQYAEDEVTPDRVECFAKSPLILSFSPRGEGTPEFSPRTVRGSFSPRGERQSEGGLGELINRI